MTVQQAFELALQHHQSGRLGEAEAIYREILTVEPRHAHVQHLLGVLAHQAGRNEAAVGMIRQAIALAPGVPDFHCNLGEVYRALGKLDEAISAYRQALVLSPNLPEAHHNLGVALKASGQLDEAIAASRQAVALNPAYFEAYLNLSLAFRENGQLDEALAAARRAVALRPGDADAYNNLGSILKDAGALDQAMAAFRQAFLLSPDFLQAHSNLILTSLYHPGYDAGAIAEEERRWSRQHARPASPLLESYPNERNSQRPLRIGYVSPDFRQHPVGCHLLPLLTHHDHDAFEVYCYAHVASPDAVTELFRARVNQWRDITGLTDEQLAARVREDRIDILVDLALHTTGNRLAAFAYKPAPVQVTFAGYPGSTGLETIDYRLSDPWLDPAGMDESIYSEQIWRLPASFWCYDPPAGSPPVNPLPALSAGYLTFGSLNNYCKVNEPVIELWSKVLCAVKVSRLLLLGQEGAHRGRALELFKRHGVEPERIAWFTPAARDQYLATYHRIDLGLDPFPYNGHVTSLDSFWMGVPVITLVGRTVVGRGGLSQAMNLGLPELVARTPEEYLRLAEELATDLPRLSGLRQNLRRRMQSSPLMDGPRFARNLEVAYRAMWHRWCAKT